MAKKEAQPRNVWDGVKMLVACNDYYGSTDSMHVDSFASFMYEAAPLINSGTISVVKTGHYIVDLQRSKIAKQAVESGFTHLYQYDADMTLELSHIERLLSHDLDIVTGTYFMRGVNKGAQFPCVASYKGQHITREEILSAGDSLIDVDSVGGGSLLTKCSVLANIGYPAFLTEWRLTGNGFVCTGEDGYFSKVAIEHGYKMYMDPKVVPDHFARIRVGIDLRDKSGNSFHIPTY